MNQDSDLETEIWMLCHEDENGDHHLVQGGLTKEEADNLKKRYELKNSNDLYCVEKVISMRDNYGEE